MIAVSAIIMENIPAPGVIIVLAVRIVINPIFNLNFKLTQRPAKTVNIIPTNSGADKLLLPVIETRKIKEATNPVAIPIKRLSKNSSCWDFSNDFIIKVVILVNIKIIGKSQKREMENGRLIIVGRPNIV